MKFVARWKHGLAFAFILGLLLAASALMVGAPLAILAEAIGRPEIANWSNILLGTGLLSLPYMLTNPDVVAVLRGLLNP